MFIVPTDMISKCCCFCILHFYNLCFCIFTSGTYTSQFTVTRTTHINGRGIEMALVINNTFRLDFQYLYYCILTFNMILICLLCHLLHTHQFTVTPLARIVMALQQFCCCYYHLTHGQICLLYHLTLLPMQQQSDATMLCC